MQQMLGIEPSNKPLPVISSIQRHCTALVTSLATGAGLKADVSVLVDRYLAQEGQLGLTYAISVVPVL